MKLTSQEYAEMLRKHPNLKPTIQSANSHSRLKNDNNSGSKIQDSKPKCHQKAALGSTVHGETKSISRIGVRFILFRVRCLDPDNAAGGCKDLLDGLRHADLIPGDEAWRIEFSVSQEKVKSYSEEKTAIEITYP